MAPAKPYGSALALSPRALTSRCRDTKDSPKAGWKDVLGNPPLFGTPLDQVMDRQREKYPGAFFECGVAISSSPT